MKPIFLPIRVMACALDPRQVLAMDETRSSALQWWWNTPQYASLEANSASAPSPVWERLQERHLPAPLALEEPTPRSTAVRWRADKKPDRWAEPAVIVSWVPPPSWARSLPDGTLPALPDRWLVLRIARVTHGGDGKVLPPGAAPAPAVFARVIDAGENNVQEPLRDSPRVVVSDKAGPVIDHIGVVRTPQEASQAEPGDASPERLTVRGSPHSQDLTFASFAPSSHNNLSFIDRLDIDAETLKRTALSYLVIGWHRRAESEPIPAVIEALKKSPPADRGAGTPAPSIEAQVLEALGFALDGDPARLTPRLSERRCVFHGMVTQIDYWNEASHDGPLLGTPSSPRAHGQAPPTDPEVKVGFGATSEEALAALLSGHTAKDDEVRHLSPVLHTLLKSLLDDRLGASMIDAEPKEWDALGKSTPQVMADLRATFRALASGREWVIQSREEAERARPPKLQERHERALAHLNRRQLQADERAWEIGSDVESLYTAWYMNFAQRRSDRGDRDGLHAPLAAIVEQWRSALREKAAALAKARGRIARLEKALQKSLGDALKLVAVDAPPFHEPKEPALALSGLERRAPGWPLPVHARTMERLGAARASDPAEEQRLPVAEPGKALEPFKPKDEGRAEDKDLFEALEGLAAEAALVEERMSFFVGFDVAKGQSLRGVANERKGEWESRMQAIYGRMRDALERPGGAKPEICLKAGDGARIPIAALCAAWFRQPWIPVFLDWQVEWTPKGGQARTLAGRTLLAHQPQAVLLDRMKRFEEVHGPSAAEHVRLCWGTLKNVGASGVLAQSLGGIHQQILQRDDGQPHLSPDDEELRRMVAGARLGPPAAGGPPPALETERRGELSITRLWVVDRFGQAFSWTGPHIHSAYGIGGSTGLLDVQRRLLEPTRLALRFDLPSGAARALPRSPVRGWVVPSLRDRALILYDGAGVPLGVLRAGAAGGTSFRGLRAGDATPMDPVLADLVEGLRGPQALPRFEALMKRIDSALSATRPEATLDSFSTASLIGRPLALVRAELRLERRGGPLLDVRWLQEKAKAESLASDRDFARREADRRRASVRVEIGCDLPDDGVLGYWESATGEARDRTHRTGCFEERPAGGQREILPTAKLGAEARVDLEVARFEQPPSKLVTLLLDPQGKIYLRPDCLPATVVTLDPSWFEEMLRRLPAVVPVEPVLLGSRRELADLLGGAGPRVDLPVPAAANPAGADAREGARLSVPTSGSLVEAPVGAPPGAAPVPEDKVSAVEGLLVI